MYLNFSSIELVEKFKIKAENFADMNISLEDIFSGKISSRTVLISYANMLKKKACMNYMHLAKNKKTTVGK